MNEDRCNVWAHVWLYIPVEAGRCVSRDKSCQAKNDERGVGMRLHLSKFSGTDRLVVLFFLVLCFLLTCAGSNPGAG